MTPTLRALTGAAGRRPVLTIVLVLVITGLLGGLAGQGELVNDNAAFAPDSDQVRASDELQDRFSDAATAAIQVVVEGDDVVSPAGVATVDAVVAQAVESFGDDLVGGERGVVSFVAPAAAVAGQQGIDLSTADAITVDRLQQAAVDGQPGAAQDGPTPGAVAELASALLSGDDPTDAGAGIVLLQIDRTAFATELDLVAAEVAFSEAVLALDTPLDATPFSFEIISDPDDDFQAEIGRLFAGAAAVILVVLAFVLRARRGTRLGWLGAIRRSAADMLTAIGTVVLAVTWTQGLQVLLGPDYLDVIGVASPPTQIIPILLLALGVDYAIHLTSRYREELAGGATDPVAVARSLGGTVGVALGLSMVTTAVGFLTNLFSPIPAIRDLGIVAAVGILSAFLLCVTFLPAVRVLLDRRPAARGELVVEEVAPREDSVFARVALVGLRPALRAPVAMITAAAVLAGAGAYGLAQLETEFDITAFIPEDSPYTAAFATLDREFSGGLAETTEVLVTGDVATVAVHNAYADVASGLDDREGIVQLGGGAEVTSPVSVFAALTPTDDAQRQALDQAVAAGLRDDGTVADDTDVAALYALLEESFPAAAGVVDVVDVDEPAARIAVRTQSESAGVEQVDQAIGSAVAPLASAGVDTVVTGQAIINDDVLTSLASSQVRGLAITVVAVMLLLGAVYFVRDRRPGLGVLVMTPVTAVVLWVFGLMAATGIPFDPITAVISALVVGLGVDFCIHLGERFVEDLEVAQGDVAAALRASLRHTGAALAGSAATTIFGFMVLATASIVPFQRLGVVTIYAVALSLLATLFVLPPILVLYGRRAGRRGSDDTTVDDDRATAGAGAGAR